MASKIEKVENSVHHLGHVLDFKFVHLKTQMANMTTQMANVTSKLDTLTHLLLQGARVGEGAEVASKLPMLPGVSRAPNASLDALGREEEKSEPTESKHKHRGVMAYRDLILSRQARAVNKDTITTDGKSF